MTKGTNLGRVAAWLAQTVLLLAVLSVAYAACGEKRTPPEPNGAEGGAGGESGSAGAAGAAAGGEAGQGGIPAGGASGSASVGGLPAELSPEHQWLTDPERWERIEAADFVGPACTVYEGLPGRDEFEPIEWESCGTGCEQADVLQGYGEFGSLPQLNTIERAGVAVPVLNMTVGINTETVAYELQRAIDVDQGMPIGTLLAIDTKTTGVSPCIFGAGPAYVALGGGSANGGEAQVLWTWMPLWTERWQIIEPPLPAAGLPLFVDFGSPDLGFLAIAGAVSRQVDRLSTEGWETIEPTTNANFGVAQGDLAVWTDYPALDSERVRGWAPDGGGARTLIESVDFDTCSVALSPDHLAGYFTTGTRRGACDQVFEGAEAHIWLAPRSTELIDPGEIRQSPPMPNMPLVAGHESLKVWGDYAALYLAEAGPDGFSVDESFFVLVRLSDWTMWRVHPSGQGDFLGAWTLTDQHLYLSENSFYMPGDTVVATSDLRRLYRFRLDQAENIGQFEKLTE